MTAEKIYCADGGANRLHDLGLDEDEAKICVRDCNMIPYLLNADLSKQPAAICGDLDSVRPDVLRHYEQQDVRIFEDDNQYKTDLMKCLKFVSDEVVAQGMRHPELLERRDVAIFGSLSGRADQAFSILNYLYVCEGDSQNPSQAPSLMIRTLYLITSESIIFCLPDGDNEIHTPVGPGALGESAGIIPLGTPATITTKGLEWDVEDWRTGFGGQVSTSNHIKSDKVAVKTTEKVLFIVEISKEPLAKQ